MRLKFFKNRVVFFSFGGLAGIIVVSGAFFLARGLKLKSLEKINWQEILPAPAPYPKNFTGVSLPEITAGSFVVLDVDSGVILTEKNPQTATAPASTTKMMTALVAFDNYSLEEIISVFDLNGTEGQKMNLVDGERISVKNLFYGLLVTSANDVALVLARNFPDGQAGFVWAMNQKVKDLGLTKTHFANPVGYDDPEHYSSPSDLAKIAAELMKNPFLAEVVGTKQITVIDESGKLAHELTNVNALLVKIPEVKGVKTGWTQMAGECLVTFVKKDNHSLIISLLGSQNRFKDTEEVIRWIFTNFIWENFPQ